MEYSFPRYLLAKQTVDDRALNHTVLNKLKENLPEPPIRIIEVGAGMGNMLARLLSWKIITHADYVHEDSLEENIEYAAKWIPRWATESGLHAESFGENRLRVFSEEQDVCVTLEPANLMDFIQTHPEPADLLIAHAFLDLLPMPESMPKLLSLTKNLAWLTINFDGLTSFEPTIDRELDATIERLYHQTMDTRRTGGDSRSGRHLFSHLRAADAQVLAAGASDWVVYPESGGNLQHGGRYPADEGYFLYFILHFFEESLTGRPELDADAFSGWLKERRAQIDRGELVYIAHQMDFLVRV